MENYSGFVVVIVASQPVAQHDRIFTKTTIRQFMKQSFAFDNE